jgi:hypothetical protein
MVGQSAYNWKEFGRKWLLPNEVNTPASARKASGKS